MAYLNQIEHRLLGFKALGQHAKLSDRVCIYKVDQIKMGDYSLIDIFHIVPGNVKNRSL